MTGVIDDRQLWNTTMQFDRYLPHRHVTIDLLVVTGETTMNSRHALHPSLIQTLQCTNPQFQVWIDRILHEYRDVHTFQSIGKSLHRKRISSSTCTYPQDIDTIFQTKFHMLRRCHFCSHQHLRLFLHLLQPYKGRLAMSFETSWLRTGLPHSCTEIMTAIHRQLLSGSHHLLLTLCTTGTCNDEGAFIVTR